MSSLGGSLAITASDGGGTTIAVRLPAAYAAITPCPAEEVQAGLPGWRILDFDERAAFDASATRLGPCAKAALIGFSLARCASISDVSRAARSGSGGRAAARVGARRGAPDPLTGVKRHRVAEIVRVPAAREARTRSRLHRDDARLLAAPQPLADERERDAGEIAAAAGATEDHVGRFTGHRHLLDGFFADHALVQTHVI